MKIDAILAVSPSLGLGYQNQLLFKNKVDLNFFKTISMQYDCCIAGRLTYESLLPNLLPNRKIVKLTKTPQTVEEISTVADIVNLNYEKILVIGGNNCYTAFENLIDTWYITYFKEEALNIDTYFDCNLHDKIKSIHKCEIIYEDKDIVIKKYYN